MLDKHKIFAANKVEVTEVPDLWEGESLYVRPLTARQYSRLEGIHIELSLSIHNGGYDHEKRQEFKNLLLLHSVCDKDGKPIFTEQDLADCDELNAFFVEALLEAAIKVNPLTIAERNELKKKSQKTNSRSKSSK